MAEAWWNRTEELRKSKEIISGSDKYSNFVLLAIPVAFAQLFADSDIDLVQLYSIQPAGDDIVGFCGACIWKNNTLTPADGDSYTKDMLVYGYDWFTNEDEGIKRGLNILVGEEW